MSRSSPCLAKMPCCLPSSGIAPSQLPRCGEAILRRSAAEAGDESERRILTAAARPCFIDSSLSLQRTRALLRPHPEVRAKRASKDTDLGLPEIGTINAQVGQARLAGRPVWCRLLVRPMVR